jgi:hypothetical protein
LPYPRDVPMSHPCRCSHPPSGAHANQIALDQGVTLTHHPGGVISPEAMSLTSIRTGERGR